MSKINLFLIPFLWLPLLFAVALGTVLVAVAVFLSIYGMDMLQAFLFGVVYLLG